MNATALERKLMPMKIPSSMPASSGLLVKRITLKIPVMIPSSRSHPHGCHKGKSAKGSKNPA
jgi:hypothetical protein